MSAFAFSMLHHGHGFELHRNFSAVESMNYAGAELKVGYGSTPGVLARCILNFKVPVAVDSVALCLVLVPGSW